MFRDLKRVINARSGARRRGSRSASSAIRRETIAAWLVGAGIWLAGLGFLALQTAPGAYAGTAAARPAPTASCALSSSNTFVQDVTGRHLLVVRAIAPMSFG